VKEIEAVNKVNAIAYKTYRKGHVEENGI